MGADQVRIDVRLMDFAVRCVKVANFLRKKHNEYSLADQILRSGTSIGANFEEAEGCITAKDYIFKISLCLKEARETLFWIKLLYNAKYIDEQQFLSLYNDCETIVKILGKTLRTRMQRLKNKE